MSKPSGHDFLAYNSGRIDTLQKLLSFISRAKNELNFGTYEADKLLTFIQDEANKYEAELEEELTKMDNAVNG